MGQHFTRAHKNTGNVQAI